MRRAAWVAPILGALIVAGCGASDSDGSVETTVSTSAVSGVSADARVMAARQGLCAAFDSARDGDLATSRREFDHGPLHELAEDAIAADRAVAARLLEAKEAVESALAADSTPAPDVADKLQVLIDATTEALVVTGSTSVDLCPEESP